jgi:N-acyl-D-amino-acid deacylase
MSGKRGRFVGIGGQVGRRQTQFSVRWIAVLGTLALLGVMTLLLFIWQRVQRHFDLVVRNVVIHDGMGSPPFRGWIGIDGDRIAFVGRGRLAMPFGTKTIDAGGADVSPGFIDTHSHADQNILATSGAIRANNFVGQGVTTIVTGNCGRSPVDIATFGRAIAARGSNINIATLIGLNSVRQEIMKDSTSPATAGEIRRLCAVVDEGMRAGAVGVSTGPAYVPGRFASDDETVAQLATAARRGGIFATHLRDEGNRILESVQEALRQHNAARMPLLISHLKIAGSANCGKYRSLARLIANDGGPAPVFTDQYPYTASSSSLDLYLPDWFLASHGSERRKILDTPAGNTRLASYLKTRIHEEGFRDFSFASIASYEQIPAWAGKSIAEIDASLGHRPDIDSQIGLIIEMLRHGGAQMVYHNICKELTLQIARRPTSMFGSDSAIRYSGGDYVPHPRGWGTFPRVLAHFVRRQNVVPLDEAIRRMTSLPASVFRLERRGAIQPGYYADLVIFDGGAISDRATYLSPFRPPMGIRTVLVNGKVVVRESESRIKMLQGIPDVTRELPGRFLVRNTRAPSDHPERWANGAGSQ